MDNLDELKEKLETRLKRNAIEEGIENDVKDVLSEHETEVQSIIKEQIAGNTLEILRTSLKEVSDNVEKTGNVFENYIEAYEKQAEKFESLSEDQKAQLENIYKVLIDNFKEYKELAQNKHFDYKKFKSIFDQSVESITKILIDRDEIPYRKHIDRNFTTKKINSITEYYDFYTLKHVWKYDSSGYLEDVETTKEML